MSQPGHRQRSKGTTFLGVMVSAEWPGVSLSRNNHDVFRSEISGEEGVRPDTHQDP